MENIEIALIEALAVLMATPSSYSTIFLMDLFDCSKILLNQEDTTKEIEFNDFVIGYPSSSSYLRRISINLWKIFKEKTNFRLIPYQMTGIVELFPLDHHFDQLFQLLRRIENETQVFDSCSYFQYLSSKIFSRLASWFTQSPAMNDLLYLSTKENTKTLVISRKLFADFVDMIELLGPRGLLYLLGIRTTIGSANIIPLKSELLFSSFEALHTNTHEDTKRANLLTVGARALCKHSHRSSTGYWGSCTGSETRKNEFARTKLDSILQTCVWINIHKMGGLRASNEMILELRVQEGYGARWSVQFNDDRETETSGDCSHEAHCQEQTQELDWNHRIIVIKFRGFVEPMMENGHEVGWKH